MSSIFGFNFLMGVVSHVAGANRALFPNPRRAFSPAWRPMERAFCVREGRRELRDLKHRFADHPLEGCVLRKFGGAPTFPLRVHESDCLAQVVLDDPNRLTRSESFEMTTEVSKRSRNASATSLPSHSLIRRLLCTSPSC